MSQLRIIKFWIVDEIQTVAHGELSIDHKAKVMYGLGLDGIIYTYHTNNKVNPLYSQPRKQKIIIKDERDKE